MSCNDNVVKSRVKEVHQSDRVAASRAVQRTTHAEIVPSFGDGAFLMLLVTDANVSKPEVCGRTGPDWTGQTLRVPHWVFG